MAPGKAGGIAVISQEKEIPLTQELIEGKKAYSQPHRYDTGWLGQDAKLIDIDLVGYGLIGFNIYEIKQRTPYISKTQLDLFRLHKLFHVAISSTSERHKVLHGKFAFEALWYDLYCPYQKVEVEYDE